MQRTPRTPRPTHLARTTIAVGVLVAAVSAAGCGGGGGGGNEGKVVTVTTEAGGGGAAVTVGAHDVYFDVARVNTPAGDLTVDLIERGTQSHTFVVDGVDGFKLEVSGGSRNDSGTLQLDAGTYTFYCDVPGHRGQGMEGTLVVS